MGLGVVAGDKHGSLMDCRLFICIRGACVQTHHFVSGNSITFLNINLLIVAAAVPVFRTAAQHASGHGTVQSAEEIIITVGHKDLIGLGCQVILLGVRHAVTAGHGFAVCVVVKDRNAAYGVIYRHDLAGGAAAHTAAKAVGSVLLEHRIQDLQGLSLADEDTAAAPVVHGIGSVVGDITAANQGRLTAILNAYAAAFGCLGHIGRHGAAGHDELLPGKTNAAAGFSAVIAGDVAIIGNVHRCVI